MLRGCAALICAATCADAAGFGDLVQLVKRKVGDAAAPAAAARSDDADLIRRIREEEERGRRLERTVQELRGRLLDSGHCPPEAWTHLRPASCEKLTLTGWHYRCEVLYPGRGTQGLVGPWHRTLEIALDLGAVSVVGGTFADASNVYEVFVRNTTDREWELAGVIKQEGQTPLPSPVSTRHVKLRWNTSKPSSGAKGIHAIPVGCGGQPAPAPTPQAGGTAPPTQWKGPTRPMHVPKLFTTQSIPKDFWRSDPQQPADKEDMARAPVTNPQPGTPPGPAVLDEVEAAARRMQEHMCSAWPDNTDCHLLTGRAEHPFWFNSLGKRKSMRWQRHEWDVLSERFAWKLVLRDEDFVLATPGSSTSAGHDTMFNASYPLAAARMLRPALAAAGLEVRTRNVAMGGNDYRDGNMWCLAPMVGEDADLVTWEWHMYGADVCSLEVYARNAMSLPRRPAVVQLVGFGDGRPGGAGTKRVPQQVWQNAEKKVSPYGRDPHSHSVPDCGDKPYGAIENAIRDTECFEREAARRGGMPFSVWQRRFAEDLFVKPAASPLPRTIDHDNPLHLHYHDAGLGFYSWAASTASEVHSKPWWLYRYKSFLVRHHCSWMCQTLAGHELAYFLLDRVLAAVKRVRADVRKAGSVTAVAQQYRERRSSLRSKPLPEPQVCTAPPTTAPTRCYTDYEPMHSPAPLSRLVESYDENTWTVAALAFQQHVPMPRQYRDIKIVTRGQAWWSPADQGPPDAGWLRLRVPATETAQDIALCFLGKYLKEQRGVARCRGNDTLVVVGTEYAEAGYDGYSAPGRPLLKLVPQSGRFHNVRYEFGEFHVLPERLPILGVRGAVPTVPRPEYDCFKVCRTAPAEDTVLELRPEPVMSVTHLIVR